MLVSSSRDPTAIMFEYITVFVAVIVPTLCVIGCTPDSWVLQYLKAGFCAKVDWKLCIELSPRGWGVQMLLASLERPLFFFLGPWFFAYVLCSYTGMSWGWGLLVALSYPLTLATMMALVFFQSQDYGEGGIGSSAEIKKKQEEWLTFNEKTATGAAFKKEWLGKKIPIETAIEAFQDQLIDFKQAGSKNLTVCETMRNRYDIFKFAITKENCISIVKDLLCRVWKHDADADHADVSDVYNRGNDFYGWFLCDKMLYSVGIWDSADESQFEDVEKLRVTINKAQDKKLDKICGELLMMREGMEHLDLGCGWGAMILHATNNYKVKSTGITLSQEQADFIASKDTKKLTDVKVINAWTWLEAKKKEGKKYDVITCLEMSEHIGIRDYQQFCHAVRDVLKDDGIFYLQIAGLRRNWQFEDIIWGLFMNRYVFPGADASCPLYWDIEQVERSGFEVRSVENNGVHYGLTIYAWYKNWVHNKAKVVAKYGEHTWRNWSIFLSWSYLIAMQGSSTVYMITLTKNLPNDAHSRAGNGVNDYGISRASLWVDKKRTGWDNKGIK